MSLILLPFTIIGLGLYFPLMASMPQDNTKHLGESMAEGFMGASCFGLLQVLLGWLLIAHGSVFGWAVIFGPIGLLALWALGCVLWGMIFHRPKK